MPARIMEQVLAWVDRAARPVLVQLPSAEYDRLAARLVTSLPERCPGSPEPVDGSISHYETGACLWAPPTKWGQETRVDVAGVDAIGPQGVALQVQRLGAIRF